MSVDNAKQGDFTCLAMIIARAIALDDVSEDTALSCFLTSLMAAGTMVDYDRLNSTLIPAELKVNVHVLPSGALEATLNFLNEHYKDSSIQDMDEFESILVDGRAKSESDRTGLEVGCIEAYKVIEPLYLCGIPGDAIFDEALSRSTPESADISVMLVIIADAKASVNSTSYNACMRKRVTALAKATSCDYTEGLHPSYKFSAQVSSNLPSALSRCQ
eukprot:6485457-Amphidinium_carterae.1